MAKWKVVILSGTYGLHVPKAIEMIREVAEVTRGKIPKDITPEKMAEAIGDADIVVLGASGRIDEEVMKRVPKLKMIAKRGVGLDNIDLKAATKAGILVTYTKHANSQSVAEHTIGLILTLTKNITIANEEVRTKGWKIRSKLIGIELSGKTLGIIGFGFIGRKVAEIAKALGMNVLVYDPYVPVDVVRGFGCRVVDLDTLLRESDVVSIHAALTKETYHMIGERELRLMKRTAYLINTARGAIIDEKALIKALKEGWIAGAALDVFEEEPLPKDHPLTKFKNVILTPHIAAFTKEAIERMDLMVAEDVVRACKGLKPRNIANPEVLEKINWIRGE